MTKGFEDLTNEEIYKQHANLLYHCGMARMAKEFKEFVVDDENREVLRLLLYYFNNCQRFETMMPNKKYKIYKHIMLCGPVGSGKTLIMQIFAYYFGVGRGRGIRAFGYSVIDDAKRYVELVHGVVCRGIFVMPIYLQFSVRIDY